MYYYFAFCAYTGLTQLHRVAYYGVLFTAVAVMMNFSKLYFIQFRPFEIDEAITMGDNMCPKEYGNPSGHSMFGPAFGGVVLLDILTTYASLTDLQQLGLTIVSAVWFFVMGYCRFLLGVHALNQVILGFMLGIWLAVSYHLLVRKYIFNYIKKTCYQFEEINKSNACYDISVALFCMLDIMFVQYYFYYNTVENEIIPENVYRNVKAKCSNYKEETHFAKATQEHIICGGFGFLCFFYVVMVKKFFPDGFGWFPFFMGIAGACE